jgi:hypothetical protein
MGVGRYRSLFYSLSPRKTAPIWVQTSVDSAQFSRDLRPTRLHMSKFIVGSRLIVAVLAAASAAACSDQSPVAPSPGSVSAGDLSATPSTAAPGVYDLSFNVFGNGPYQEVSSLAVSSQELILKAYVTDSSGHPAQKGTVTFEYCSFKGGPPNDIERADEAPKEACEQGLARWSRLTSISVTAGSCPTLGTGYACMNFGIVRIPRDVGFRIRYQPQGSGIAAGMTVPENFTWVAGP